MCEYFNRRLRSDLSQQRRGGSAEVVGDEQLGVRVDPCWVQLPQWLETQRSSGTITKVHSGGSNMHVEAVLTIPVRSSNNNAPRLHQSHASVIRDTPPISATKE